MMVRMLQEAPEPELADALEIFERGFTYPLGEGRTFRISHGRDYPRFFRAIGGTSAASFVAAGKRGEVLGTLGVAIRALQFPDGQCRRAAYLGDLRTVPGPTRGRTLLQLSAVATKWCLKQGAVVAYGVVMDGTARLPSEYTGRFGMYPFEKIHQLCVLRIPVEYAGFTTEDSLVTDASSVERCFRQLSAGAFAPLGGSPETRSKTEAQHLVFADQSACGILEDTRLAKRLIADDGREMLTTHLSQFAYANPESGVRLLRQALRRCEEKGLAPAMFVAIPHDDLDRVTELLGNRSGIVVAPATVYGTEFTSPLENWHISTSEI